MRNALLNGPKNEEQTATPTPTPPATPTPKPSKVKGKPGKAAVKPTPKKTAEITPMDVLRSFSVSVENRKGETLTLPGWLIAPSGGMVTYRNGPQVKIKWDFITLRPGPKPSDEVARAEYVAFQEIHRRICQKAGSEVKSKDVIKATAKHVSKGKNKGKHRVALTLLAKVKAQGANDQLAHARALATAAKEFLHPTVA